MKRNDDKIKDEDEGMEPIKQRGTIPLRGESKGTLWFSN